MVNNSSIHGHGHGSFIWINLTYNDITYNLINKISADRFATKFGLSNSNLLNNYNRTDQSKQQRVVQLLFLCGCSYPKLKF